MKSLFHLDKNKKIEIKNILKEILEQKTEIIFTYIHGSFLLSLPFHDIDLAIFIDDSYINKKNSLDYELQLAIELELKIKYPIDVKIINFAPLSFQYQITKGNLLFSKDQKMLYNFIEKTWIKYLDFMPYLNLSFRYLFNIK